MKCHKTKTNKMKRVRTTLVIFFLLITSFFSCKKDDYGSQINDLRQQIAAINSRLDSISNAIKDISTQLTYLNAATKTKISSVNSRIDSISDALNTVTSKTIVSLSNDIKSINNSISVSNSATISKIDSINKTIKTLDSSIIVSTQNSNNLKDSYNNLLANYLTILQILKTQPLTLIGKIEKGPFSKGSIISFYELNSNLSQTGKSYSTTINDNNGNYELKLSNGFGNLVRVQADGFYFNEVLNSLSTSRIVLTGISKIDSSETINVNVFTHLERRRVEYLMTQNGLSFDAAKKQAVTELLTVFGLSDPTITRSEKINLLGNNKQSDILLNASLLFQGYRTDAQLSELLTDFSNDFYVDGKIDSSDILKRIYNHSIFIDSNQITNTIKSKFNITPNSFSILKDFINNGTTYKDENYMPIIYPATYNGIKNLLVRIPTDTILSSFNNGTATCFIYTKNDIPTFDFKVTVKSIFPPSGQENMWMQNGTAWSISSFDMHNYGNQTFYTNNPVGPVNIYFYKGEYDLLFYEPANATNPTFIKRLVVK